MPRAASFVAHLIVAAALAHSSAARADEAPVEEAGTIPVLVRAGGDRVLLDEMACLRAACDGRVRPGRHRVTVQVLRDGTWVTDLEEDVDIEEPSEIRVERPGFIRKTAVVTTVAGAAIVLAGVLVPAFVCNSSSTTDPTTGQVRSDNPCRDLPTPLLIGWVAGIGIGITLGLVGGIALATTSGASRITTRRWALVPLVAPRVGEGSGSTFGLGVVVHF